VFVVVRVEKLDLSTGVSSDGSGWPACAPTRLIELEITLPKPD
jgi:hypothetical protein